MSRPETFNPEDPIYKDRIEFSNVEVVSLNPIKKGKEWHYHVRCKNCGKEYYKAKWTF